MRRLAAVALVVAGLIAGSAVPASAGLDDELSNVQSEIDQLRSQVSGVRSERSDLANEILDTGDRLEALQAELAEAEGRLAETDAEIAATEAAIADLTGRMADRRRRVADLGDDIDGIRDEAVARAVELYMQGQASSAVAMLGIEDITRVNVGLAYAARLQEVSDRAIVDLEALSTEAAREEDRLERERMEAEQQGELLAFQRDERSAAADAVEGRTAEVAAELAALEGQLAEMNAAISEIEYEIAGLQREEDQIQALIIQQSNSGGSRPGVLLRPVPGGVSSYYGYRIHPIYGERRLHTGWDMNAGCGAPIKAAESGVVIFAGVKGGYGNAVIIDHGGGMSTLYGHQSKLGVSYGQTVGIGDVIGWIGSTGVSTACHLHFEVRINGVPVDPAPYL
ncbi:MAG: peptidoglycan DD-metalloendopeptidase family protein [Actinobacteria bacterium]|nr:peptidoglycan DD-metalloendopeptidase family protein [Actinomycetota bacterium]